MSLCQESLTRKSPSQHFVSPNHAMPIDYGITRLQLLEGFGIVRVGQGKQFGPIQNHGPRTQKA